MYCIAEVIQSIFHKLACYTIYKNIKSLCYWRERASWPRWRISARHQVKNVRNDELRGHAEHCACAARGPRLVGLLRAGETAAPALCHGRAPASGARRELCTAACQPGEDVAVAAVPDRRGKACLQFPGSWGLLPASQLAPCRPWVQCGQCEQRYNGRSPQDKEKYSYIPEINVNMVSQLYFSTQKF